MADRWVKVWASVAPQASRPFSARLARPSARLVSAGLAVVGFVDPASAADLFALVPAFAGPLCSSGLSDPAAVSGLSDPAGSVADPSAAGNN